MKKFYGLKLNNTYGNAIKEGLTGFRKLGWITIHDYEEIIGMLGNSNETIVLNILKNENDKNKPI